MDDIELVIQKQIENTKIGEDVVLSFKGEPTIIDIEMVFAGGWIIKQEIIPGKELRFTKGEEGGLTDLTIKLKDYKGLR
ncbi:hypothetical protein BCU83_18425 [Vibrio breoganii]|uniref:hypothetical protein n=1 Tax=Vibrio breoganii TaxID=553239 RepID=UPI000C84EF53|nr:hypothetical protein [Vibrio breoganii]PMG84773.1 hypothetical protein BCU83_18425 [Vibrio breoganii]